MNGFKQKWSCGNAFKLANLEIHVVDQSGLEGKDRQSAGEGDEVAKEREEASTEGGEGHVRGASDESHEHAVSRPLVASFLLETSVHEFVERGCIHLLLIINPAQTGKDFVPNDQYTAWPKTL